VIDSRSSTLLRCARGSLLGLAVGDALGAPLEGAKPSRARKAVEAGLEMSGGRSWAPGEWTDDTALALALAESIASRGLLDTADVAARYIEWARIGKGIGSATAGALRGAVDDAHARAQAESFHESTGMSAGNGTVMRVAPIGLAAPSVEMAAEAAREDARLTHFDPATGAASAALCAALIAIRDGGDPLAAAEGQVEDHGKLTQVTEGVRNRDAELLAELAGGLERGACWTTLGIGLYSLEAIDDYERGVLWAIALGGDTDTNAAVAGALLGCRHGPDVIPERWLSPLRERERIERATEALAERAAAELS
jgi:ADP-ribosyl-[dinitrogen reductase] hydrolase